jgi:hypothetical protein
VTDAPLASLLDVGLEQQALYFSPSLFLLTFDLVQGKLQGRGSG